MYIMCGWHTLTNFCLLRVSVTVFPSFSRFCIKIAPALTRALNISCEVQWSDCIIIYLFMSRLVWQTNKNSVCTHKHLSGAEPTLQRLEHCILGQRPREMDQVTASTRGRPVAAGPTSGGRRRSMERSAVSSVVIQFSLLLRCHRRRRIRRRRSI